MNPQQAHFKLMQILPVRTIPARLKASKVDLTVKALPGTQLLHDQIFVLRKAGKKQREIAKALKVSRQMVGRYLLGNVKVLK